VAVIDATDPQKLGSAISYGRRYAYCCLTGVQPEDEDDDAQAARTKAPRRGREAERDPEPSGVETDSGEEYITTADADGRPGGQKKRLLDILAEHKVSRKEFGSYIQQHFGATSWNLIRRKDYDKVVAVAQAWPRPSQAEPVAIEAPPPRPGDPMQREPGEDG
jgi:hypothetical protein